MVNRLAIDLFSGDRVTDFNAVYASGVRLVIHKASEGSTYRDRTYAERRNAARAAGLMWGAYHYSRGGNVDNEVANFLAAANPDATTRLILDWEVDTVTVSFARAFLQAVDNEIGRPTIVYSYSSFLKEVLGANRDTFLGLHPLWIAQYSATPPVLQPTWDRYLLWQYSESGSVPGISGAVDCNHFDGTEADLKAAWLADATKPVTAPAPAEPWEGAAWQMFPDARLAWTQSTINGLNPSKPPMVVDGLDGPITQNAVRSFQRAQNLTIDGIVGPQTTSALKAVLTQTGV